MGVTPGGASPRRAKRRRRRSHTSVIVPTVERGFAEARRSARRRSRGRARRSRGSSGRRKPAGELPREGGHQLEEAALPFAEEGVEGERRLAGAGDAGDDGQAPARNLEVEALEVVLARAPDDDRRAGAGAGHRRTDSLPGGASSPSRRLEGCLPRPGDSAPRGRLVSRSRANRLELTSCMGFFDLADSVRRAEQRIGPPTREPGAPHPLRPRALAARPPRPRRGDRRCSRVSSDPSMAQALGEIVRRCRRAARSTPVAGDRLQAPRHAPHAGRTGSRDLPPAVQDALYNLAPGERGARPSGRLLLLQLRRPRRAELRLGPSLARHPPGPAVSPASGRGAAVSPEAVARDAGHPVTWSPAIPPTSCRRPFPAPWPGSTPGSSSAARRCAASCPTARAGTWTSA